MEDEWYQVRNDGQIKHNIRLCCAHDNNHIGQTLLQRMLNPPCKPFIPQRKLEATWMMKFNSPSVQEAKPHDGLSDRNFFKKFPDATHRTRPWRVRDELSRRPAERLSERRGVEEGWITVARRDGFRLRLREMAPPFLPWDDSAWVVLRHPAKGAGMVIDYGPIGFGVRDWS